jgi:hypothetical protein
VLIKVPGWNVQYILCRWVDAVKNMPSTLKTLLKRVWQKDGDLPPDSISAYSEMPGEHSRDMDALYDIKKETNEQLDKAMKAPIDQDRIRKAGW